MDFTLPEHLPPLLAEMDAFIEAEIKPLERENMQYFDRRREFARTDLDKGGKDESSRGTDVPRLGLTVAPTLLATADEVIE